LVAAFGAVAVLRPPRRGALRALLLLLAGATLPVLPWLVRGLLFHADPFYPVGTVYLSPVFGVPESSAIVRDTYRFWMGDQGSWAKLPMDAALICARDGAVLAAAIPLFFAGLRPGIAPFLAGSAAALAGLMVSFHGEPDFAARYAYPLFVMWNILGWCLLAPYRSEAHGTRRAPYRALNTGPQSKVHSGAGLAAGRKARPALGSAWTVLARLSAILFGARLLASHLSLFPGIQPAEFLAGRLEAEEFRMKSLYGYGVVLPLLCRADARFASRAALVTIGNRFMWGIPARVVGEGFEPAFIWGAFRESATVERAEVRFRQANIRWILYNAPLAGWARRSCVPCPWDGRMARLYVEFARRHLATRAWSGRVDKLYGCDWLFEVTRGGGAPAARVPFLPGAERLFCGPTTANMRGDAVESAREFAELRREYPEVVALDAMLGRALLLTGHPREAYPLLRSSVSAGVVYEMNLFNVAIAAGWLGRRAEAEAALRRAAEVYPLWPETVEQARRDITGR
jgi:hypothetical protein